MVKKNSYNSASALFMGPKKKQTFLIEVGGKPKDFKESCHNDPVFMVGYN